MRREVRITIPGARSEEPGQRDNGKVFILTEMPADQGERWCLEARVLMAEALGQPAPSASAGEAEALASMGIDLRNLRVHRALLNSRLDDMWTYVQYQHKPGAPPQPIVSGENSSIEEQSTRLLLRVEALKLNLGFSGGAERPSSDSPRKSPD